MSGQPPRHLGHLIVTPLATVGVLSAVLVWEIEHVGSVTLAIAIFAVAVGIGVIVARRLRSDIERLTSHYEALLTTADQQSRRADTANRLKDEFVATVSHELRTPLNSVLGWSRLLASGKLDEEQSTRAVQAIERAGWAQSRLIEDLLDISQIVGGKFQISLRPTKVQPLVEAAATSLRAAADAKHIAFNLSLSPSIEPIAVDADRIQQVVWNLVSNAIKFTPSGGRVDIELTTENDQLCLVVRDTGVGFNPDVAAHLFERFRQGDSSPTRQFGGLGLGLGIVRHVVELHGGTVSASSAGNNTGASFVVRFPMRQVDMPVTEASAPAAPPPSLRGVTVLVVDDDPQALDFERTTLEHYGAFVVTASSAKEASDRFKRNPTDVIVSDLVMANGDGLQLIRDIRKLDDAMGRLTPAAALTALARADDRRLALNAGYQMHVAKPVDPDELAATVARLARIADHQQVQKR